jgi:coenzyme PQQ precursor peptide PqqA
MEYAIGTTVATPTTPSSTSTEENIMAWETPTYNDIRFGFEVTMYINNR